MDGGPCRRRCRPCPRGRKRGHGGDGHQDPRSIIAEELNIKEVLFTEDVEQFVSYSFKPQLRLLGQKFGKKLGEVRNALAELDGQKAKKELDTTGTLKLALSDGEASLTEEELLIEPMQVPGYETLSDRGVTVVLDTNLTDALIEEGFVREVISKIDQCRDDNDHKEAPLYEGVIFRSGIGGDHREHIDRQPFKKTHGDAGVKGAGLEHKIPTGEANEKGRGELKHILVCPCKKQGGYDQGEGVPIPSQGLHDEPPI